ELEACRDPEALDAAVRRTGLGLRSNRPRVYVVASLAGGTGSGMFLDLAYVLRAQLRQLGYADPEVIALLLMPTVEPPAEGDGPGTGASAAARQSARVVALGNTFAALAELAHFGTPGRMFQARYLEHEPALQDANPPFGRCYVLPIQDESDAVVRARTAL